MLERSGGVARAMGWKALQGFGLGFGEFVGLCFVELSSWSTR